MSPMARTLLSISFASGLLMTQPANAEVHGVILTISTYQGGIPPLKGVQLDAGHARAMAISMGVPEANILSLADSQLTAARLLGAFDELIGRVQSGDQVFIYYSGHGGRTALPAEQRCAEALIGVDGSFVLDREIEIRLSQLRAKASRVFLFVDACHSGGVSQRELASPPDGFAAKFWAPKDAQACSRPVNVIAQTLDRALRSPGEGGANVTYVAAARADEVSLDQPGRGGLATVSWLDCMETAKDLNGSGAVTADEVAACAQERIDRALARSTSFRAPHLVIHGNDRAVVRFAAEPVLPPGAAATTAAPPAQAPSASAEALQEAPARAQSILGDLYNNRDDRRRVEITAHARRLTIGKDPLELAIRSSHGGHLYLFMAGSDGRSLDLLFPNRLDADNRINAGTETHLPGTSWQITAGGPEGKDVLLAIVAEKPLDVGTMRLEPTGPFSMLAPTAGHARALLAAARGGCSGAICGSPYGAGLLVVEEVR